MALICEVKMSPNGRTYFYDAQNFSNLKKNDNVIIVFNECQEFATVSKALYQSDDEKIISKLGEIKRIATEKDLEIKRALEEKNKQAYPKILEAIKKYELSMKLVDVRYSHDGTKIFISYIAENRVDFRELVKYLASIFKIRVELRQISMREEAKMFGGCGPCGKELCCGKFLDDTTQVTVKMAKTQGISLNPSKINGMCGKLMCCLSYEYPEYQQVLDKMPPVGTIVKTKFGDGVVVFQDLLKETVSVRIGENEDDIKEISLKELEEDLK